MNMNHNKPEQDLQTPQPENQQPEQGKTTEKTSHKPMRFTRVMPSWKADKTAMPEMDQPETKEKEVEITEETTINTKEAKKLEERSITEESKIAVDVTKEDTGDALKTPFRGLLKKHILTAEELEEKILKTAEQPQKKYQSDSVKKKKKLEFMKARKETAEEEKLIPEKPRLKGAEQFDHDIYFQEKKAASKTKSANQNSSWFHKGNQDKNKKNNTNKTIPSREKQDGFFTKYKETINRMGMTAAVLLIVISAYIGINQAQSGEQDVILPITDTVPVDGANKVEVIEQQTPDAQNGTTGTRTPAQQTEAGNITGNSGQNQASTTPSVNNDNDYFINYRLERERIRSQQLDLLEDMVDDEATLPEVRKEAQEKVLSITNGIEQELLLESLLVAKYGGEAVVFVQPEKVNVVLRKNQDKMSDNEAEKIAQMVDTYTGIGFENAIIVIKE